METILLYLRVNSFMTCKNLTSDNFYYLDVVDRFCRPGVRVHLGWFFQSARDWSLSDAASERVVGVTTASSISFIIRAGGGGRPRASAPPWWRSSWRGSLGGERLGDILLGDRRSRLGDLTLGERLGDMDRDLDQRELLPLLLRCGEGVSKRWIICLFEC